MTKARDLAVFNAAGVLTSTSTLNPSNLDDTGTIPSALLAGVGADNTPAFSAKKTSADQSLSGGGDVKVDYNNQIYDSDNCFSNSRFTPNEAGKYYIQASAYVDSNAGNTTLSIAGIKIKKNGSTTLAKQKTRFDGSRGRTMTQQISCVVDMNGTSDYIEVYAHGETSSGAAQVRAETDGGSNFMGFKIA